MKVNIVNIYIVCIVDYLEFTIMGIVNESTIMGTSNVPPTLTFFVFTHNFMQKLYFC